MASIKISPRLSAPDVALEDYCKNDVNIIDNIVKEAAKRMQEEMDRHLMYMVLKEDGWATEITIDPWKHGSTSAIEHWCKTHTKYWYRSGNNFLFKFPEDATMFILRWS